MDSHHPADQGANGLSHRLGGSVLAGSLAAGAAQIPGLAAKGIFAMVLFYAVGFLLERAHVGRVIRSL